MVHSAIGGVASRTDTNKDAILLMKLPDISQPLMVLYALSNA